MLKADTVHQIIRNVLRQPMREVGMKRIKGSGSGFYKEVDGIYVGFKPYISMFGNEVRLEFYASRSPNKWSILECFEAFKELDLSVGYPQLTEELIFESQSARLQLANLFGRGALGEIELNRDYEHFLFYGDREEAVMIIAEFYASLLPYLFGNVEVSMKHL
jgi:hypothetical protein